MRDLVSELMARITAQRKHIVIIGDIILDRWVHGHLAPCQDNCQKFVQDKVVDTPGGAANAANSISEWTKEVALYGYTPEDCPVKTRYINKGKIVFRHDDDGLLERARRYVWAYNLALEMVDCAGAVLLSDYDKGFLTPRFIHKVVELCDRRGIPCVADAKRGPELYTGCIIKANSEWGLRYLAEGERLTWPDGVYVETHGARYPALWQGSRWLVTTIPDLLPVSCVNHVGAGDCFAAHLTLALAYGFSLKEAAALAHSAGRVYVQYPHNRPPTPTEIAADLASAVPASAQSPASQPAATP